MANPSYYQQTSPAATSVVQHLEHRFHMYAHQQYGKNEHTIVPPKELPNRFGCTNVMDWGLLDAPRVGATVIGQLRGVGISAGMSTESWYTSFSLVFTDQRFKGSTLNFQGPLGPPRLPDEGAWAVVGGTGEFAYAQGTVAYKRSHHDPETDEFMIELNILVICLTIIPKPEKPAVQQGIVATKIGVWGGNEGQARDITEPPKRLESITISSGSVVDSIAFSYFGQSGQKHTAGPWGGNVGNRTTVQLSDSEFVKEVSGTFAIYVGHVVIRSIKIVANVKTYGPFGREDGTSFIAALPGNSAVVGFFGRSGQYLDAIGVYVHPL